MGINHPVIPRIVAIRPEPSQSEDGETTSPSCLIFYEDGSVTRSFHSAEDEFFSFSRFIAHKMYGSNYKGDPYHQHKLGYVLLDDYIFLKMEMQTLSPTCGYVCLQDIDCVEVHARETGPALPEVRHGHSADTDSSDDAPASDRRTELFCQRRTGASSRSNGISTLSLHWRSLRIAERERGDPSFIRPP